MCTDYSLLNVITLEDRYSLPMISDQLVRLAERRHFTTLDLAQRYQQMPTHPDSIDLITIITPDGQYEYLVVTFRLLNHWLRERILKCWGLKV